MDNYLTTLITEKGVAVADKIDLAGHYGLTWTVLIDFICSVPESEQLQIRKTLVQIDFNNGDVFHYLNFLAAGMVKSLGY